MGRKRRPNEPSSYVAAPEVPEQLAQRIHLLVSALAQTVSVSDAAAQAQMARVNFQTLMHRAKAALVGVLLPRPSGPPATSPQMKALARKVERLEKEVTKQAKTIATMDELLGV